MHNNRRKWPIIGVGAIITLLIVIGLVFQTSKTSYRAQGLDWLFSNDDPSIEELSDEDLQAITDVYYSIQQFYIDDVDKAQLLEGALKGMVDSLEDPYSEFLNVQESVDITDSMEGSFHGVGIQMISRDGEITVVSPIDGTPASEAGILPNDVILEADGIELTGMDTNEVVQLIRGEIDTPVTLQIQRGTQTFEVEIIRAEIPIITVTGELDENHPTIGNVQVTQFNGTTYEEMAETIESLREQGAEAFVFDFRYNPGGLLDQALAISNMFLEDNDIIMQMEESGTLTTTYVANDSEYGDFQVTEPYVLLINQGSASASEILAAAIKENTNAPIAGQTTFGKGSVQTILNSSEYGELKLTFARWLTPSGEWIHEEGVAPTIEIESHPVNEAVMLDTEETLALGDISEQIESLTVILNALGYDVEQGNYFDQIVEEAVKSFQAEMDLEVTGEVTGDTAYQLNEEARIFIEENDAQYDEAVNILLDLEIEDVAA